MKKGIVLLLDDEENIRKDLGKDLQEAGYGVHKAKSSEEARKIILSEEIDFAIVDLKIDYATEFGGLDVVKLVKRYRPKAKAIVLSAYSEDDFRPRLEGVALDGYVPKGGPSNYIDAVLERLAELEKGREPRKCFVIMPFSTTPRCTQQEWDEIFETVIKPAVEDSGFNYQCSRSQAMMGNIIEEILDELNRADLVVADLTDRNPNVFYELGVRHALRGSTILIAQDLNDIPFDLRPYATQQYNWKLREERERFRQRIRAIIQKIEHEPEKAQSPVRKYLNL